MTNLRAQIDWINQTVTFSGSGTFQAKETIKELTSARWQGAGKVWVASSVGVTAANLAQKFPDIEIEQIGECPPTEPSALGDEGELLVSPTDHSALSVSELITQIRSAITSAFPRTVFIKGVITKVTEPKHLYIELADHDRRSDHVSCFVWHNEIERVCKSLFEKGFKLEPDLDVMFEVSVGLNPRKSSISLSVRSIVVEYTIGKLAALREKTNECLKQEGLFELNKAQSLDFLPVKLGVITSASGTVINDFRASLSSARFGFRLLWFKANVQGAEAKKQILEGLRVLSNVEDIDAILLIRGGGSPAELSIFNDYDIAKTICLCPVPVISAIGHQEDRCSAQDVSFRAHGVPKDVGHYFAEIVTNLRIAYSGNVSMIQDHVGRILQLVETQLQYTAEHIVRSCQQLVMLKEESISGYRISLPNTVGALHVSARRRLIDIAKPIPAFSKAVCNNAWRELVRRLTTIGVSAQSRVDIKGERLIGTTERLGNGCRRVIENASVRLERVLKLPIAANQVVRFGELELDKHKKLIEAISPEAQLKRGFVLVRQKSDLSYVTSGTNLKSKDEVEMQFHDLRVSAKIN